MFRSAVITFGLTLVCWSTAIYTARKSTIERPPIIVGEAVVKHWECREAFGEQTDKGIVIGCDGGRAQYDYLPLTDPH